MSLSLRPIVVPPTGETRDIAEIPRLCPQCLSDGKRIQLEEYPEDWEDECVHGLGVCGHRRIPARFQCEECTWHVKVARD